MKKYSRFFFLPLIAIFLSCSKDSDVVSSPEIYNYERVVFGKIDQLSEKVTSLYSGFDFLTTRPYYLIILNPDNQESTGYLFNPPTPPDGAYQLSIEESSGLNIYRYDVQIDPVRESLNGGLFDFYYDINGTDYFVHDFREIDNFYLNYKNQDDNMIPGLIIHELFHIYQFDNWIDPIRNNGDFPLTKEIIELQLLLYNLMIEAYKVDQGEYENYLRYYVSIWNAMILMDNSSESLITTMGTTIELSEGSARYIEHFSLKETFFASINEDPSHGFQSFLDEATDESSIRSALLFRAWYHQGAIATHILKQLGVDIETGFAQGSTPYELAREHFDLTDIELNETLEEAKSLVDWEAYQLRAEELNAIVN